MNFRIKEARRAANLTQRDLASELGITVSTLSGYETGAHDPKSNTLADIARICGTTVDYLLGIDHLAYDAAAASAEKQLVDLDELENDEAQFLMDVAALTPSDRRLLLGILALLLQEQSRNVSGPD